MSDFAIDQSDKLNFVKTELKRELKWSYRGQRSWSFANHGATICIIVFSSLAAVLAQITGDTLGSIPVKNITTTLSLVVTILSAVQSKIGFERKWIANRITRSGLAQLRIDLKSGLLSPEDAAKKLKEILGKHDQAITGSNG